MKINLTIDTEVSKDIEAAISLLKGLTSAPAPEKKQAKEKKEPAKQEKEDPGTTETGEEKPEISQEDAANLRSDIRVLLQQKVKTKETQEKAKAKLTEMGAPNVTQLQDEKLNDFKLFLESL